MSIVRKILRSDFEDVRSRYPWEKSGEWMCGSFGEFEEFLKGSVGEGGESEMFVGRGGGIYPNEKFKGEKG